MPCCRFGVSSRLSGERGRGPLCDFSYNTLTLGQNHQGIVVKIRAGLSITAYTGTFHGSPAKLCNACARLLLLFALIGVAPLATAGKVDLRVLIDVSGSMKHNDPSNLRRPAVAGYWGRCASCCPTRRSARADRPCRRSPGGRRRLRRTAAAVERRRCTISQVIHEMFPCRQLSTIRPESLPQYLGDSAQVSMCYRKNRTAAPGRVHRRGAMRRQNGSMA